MNKARLQNWIREPGWFAVIIVGDKRAYGLRLPLTMTTITAGTAAMAGYYRKGEGPAWIGL